MGRPTTWSAVEPFLMKADPKDKQLQEVTKLDQQELEQFIDMLNFVSAESASVIPKAAEQMSADWLSAFEKAKLIKKYRAEYKLADRAIKIMRAYITPKGEVSKPKLRRNADKGKGGRIPGKPHRRRRNKRPMPKPAESSRKWRINSQDDCIGAINQVRAYLDGLRNERDQMSKAIDNLAGKLNKLK